MHIPVETTHCGPRFSRYLLIGPSALVIFFSSFGVLAANILSSDEDHIQIFMWVANQKASTKARNIADDHCERYKRRAKFKSLEKNVYAYDCVPIHHDAQTVPVKTASTSLAQKEKALGIINDSADRLCEEIPTESQQSKLELSGNAKAELDGLIKKFVDLEIAGAGEYEKSDQKRAVLEKDLAQSIANRNDCKMKVFDRLVDKFIPD